MPVTPMISIQDAKKHLDIPDSDIDDDAEIGSFILAATEIVNSRCGYTAPTTITETVFAGNGYQFVRPRFILSHTPVLSLTAITPTQVGILAPDMTQVTFDPETGVVYFANWMVFYGTFTVTYVAGRTEVPDALQLACKIIVADLWETQRGTDSLPNTGDEPDMAPDGDGIPYRALQLMRIAPYSAAPGIA